MIKRSLKNYFVSLKYFFTPLGTMFFGILLGLGVLMTAVKTAISDFGGGAAALLESTSIDMRLLTEKIWECVKALDWTNPSKAITKLTGKEWLSATLMDSVNASLTGESADLAESVNSLTANFVKSIKDGLIAFISLGVTGYVAGFVLTKALIRKSIARRSLWQLLLYTLINGVFASAVTAFGVWISGLWASASIFTVFLTAVFYGFVSLLEAYMVFGRKKVPIKKVVNGKNILKYIAANIIIFTISSVITVICYVMNALVGIFVGLTLIVISVIVISMNAESYVMETVENSALDEETDTPLSETSITDENPLAEPQYESLTVVNKEEAAE